MIGLDKAGESKVTEVRSKAIIQEGAEDGEVQEVEQELVERVFNLGDRNVGSIMTHAANWYGSTFLTTTSRSNAL